MLTNNYLANLIVKDHRNRLLEEARKVRLLEEAKKPESKVRGHHHVLRIFNYLKFFELRLQNKKL